MKSIIDLSKHTLTNFRFKANLEFKNLCPKFYNFLKIRDIIQRTTKIPKERVIIKTCNDLKILINPNLDKGLERKLYYYGSYEEGTLGIIDQVLEQGDYFIDVGANIGLMSLVASKKIESTGRVIAFEPHPHTFNILKKNIWINHIHNIIPVNYGVGASVQEQDLYSNLQHNRGSASIVNKNKNETPLKIRIVRLDKYLKEENIPSKNIKMIKIDVEGFELEVIKGASSILQKKEAPILCIEYSLLHPIFNGKHTDIFHYIMNTKNYEMYKFSANKNIISKLMKINAKEELPVHDNIFAFPNTLLDKYHHLFK